MNAGRSTRLPVVSVVMPTYNGERFLRPAIESILNQTFRDFELIVIDDGSSDGTPGILSEFKDDRIVVLKNESNLGIAKATNRGLAAACGEYVALQDHDDISLPHRLQTEVEFLKAHSEIALIGSAATLIDENGLTCGDFPQPCEEIDLKWELIWSCPIHHTSVMVRRSAIVEVGGYPEDAELQFAEAWEPLARIAMGHGMINLPDRLVLWRRHSAAISIRNQRRAQASCDTMILRNISRFAGGDDATEPCDVKTDLQRRYSGLRAFLFTPGGKIPDLPAEQVISGSRLLCEVQARFYRINNFPRAVVARHRRSLNWVWGKHAVALAIRAPWRLLSRVRIFALGLSSITSAAGAAFFTGMAALTRSKLATRRH
jgi:hypothetical protein